MQSDAAFYYVLDMPAEVMRQSSKSGRGVEDGEEDDKHVVDPVWTKVGVFPARQKK